MKFLPVYEISAELATLYEYSKIRLHKFNNQVSSLSGKFAEDLILNL